MQVQKNLSDFFRNSKTSPGKLSEEMENSECGDEES